MFSPKKTEISNQKSSKPNAKQMQICIFGGKKAFLCHFMKRGLFLKRSGGGDERKIPTLLKRPDLQPINICRVRYAHVQWNITSLLHTHADTNTDTQTHGRSLRTSPTQPPPMQTPTNSQPNFRHMPLDSVPRPPQALTSFHDRHWSKHSIYRATNSCTGSKCSLLIRW